jgi:polynucleotide 5'-kinase involved in rRNA processing
VLRGHVKDLFDMNAENAYFIGLTSPSTATKEVIEGLLRLKEEVAAKEAELIIINTDGWIEGEDAASYKLRLVDALKPDVVVGIQQSDELLHILSGIGGTKVYTVDSPPVIKKRDREKRKVLRELSYKKYLRGGKVQSFLINWVKLEGTLLGKGIQPSRERMKQIENLLGVRPWYCEETQKTLMVVLGRSKVTEENIKRLEENIKKRIKIFREGEESGLIASLKDANGKFLGIGVLQGIDYRRRAIKIYTPVKGEIHTVHIGQVKLDREGREIGICTIFTD